MGAIGVPLRLLGVQEVREDVRGNAVTERRREGVNDSPPDGRAARGWCASAFVTVQDLWVDVDVCRPDTVLNPHLAACPHQRLISVEIQSAATLRAVPREADPLDLG